jgi:uncharacterized protein YhfF
VDAPDEPDELLGYPAFGFVGPGPVREQLTAAVLDGRKTATSSLAIEYALDGDGLARPGERSVVYDSAVRPVAIIETVDCGLSTIALVDDAFAHAEGEGFRDAHDWRVAHERYWRTLLADLRRRLGDPTFDLEGGTVVVCEWFRLVARIDPADPARIAWLDGSTETAARSTT